MADDVTEDVDLYVPVTCVMCRQVHHVNPLTGNVLGAGAKGDQPHPGVAERVGVSLVAKNGGPKAACASSPALRAGRGG
jgi:hypothetical protein